MDAYDEDLTENKFFAAFQHKSSNLFNKATENRWMLCVPRSGSLNNFTPQPQDFENHVLQPLDEDPGKFSTISEKELTIQSSIITTGLGFAEKRAVPILFEETFFNTNDESYRVLCINQPLEGGHATPEDANIGINIQSLEDCAELLWGRTNNAKTQKQLDDQIEAFQKSLKKLEGQSLRAHVDAANSLFTRAMQIVLKDNILKRAARHNQALMEALKLAVETYSSHGIYHNLFRNVCTCVASKDSHLNKVTRNLASLQLRDLGVRLEFGQNVPRARKELSNLGQYGTPLGKLNCLRRVVKALTHPTASSNKELALTTDDLLPILVFLVVKAEMPNWFGNLAFIAGFRFSKSTNDDEFGFYLASLEAALEHVSSGQLDSVLSGQKTFKTIQMATSPGGNSLWQRPESETSAVERLFQHIQENNIAGVESLLNKTPTPVNKDQLQQQLCHPLCCCEKCGRVWAASWEAEANAQVTVYSRDDRGYTVLHVAALYGYVELADQLIQRGALVNATDYHGATPLHIACHRGYQSLLLLLLHFKANLNMQENDGNTALHLATANGHEDCVKALVYHDQSNHFLNKNVVNDFGDTALHIGAKWGFYAIVELLLQSGAKPDIRNRKNLLPVHLAHNVKVAKLLQAAVEEPAKLSSTPAVPENRQKTLTRRHSTPVGIQASVPVAVTVKPAIKTQGSRPKPVKRVRVSTPVIMQHASSKKLTFPQERRVEKLLKAVADGDEQMVRFHLGWCDDSDEDVPEVDIGQQSLCHPLCQCSKCQPLQKLLSVPEDGLHVNCHNSDGYRPLHVAATHAHLGLVDLFLKRGANADAANFTQDASAVHLACKNNRGKVVGALIHHGASVNRRDSMGNSPLLLCCMSGNDNIATVLLENGADVNSANMRGNTALHEAARWNFLATVRVLLSYGADVNQLNRQNLTPIQVTQNSRISTVLEEHIMKGCAEKEADNPTVPWIETEPPGQHGPCTNDVLREVFTSLEESYIQQHQAVCSSIHQFNPSHGLRRTISRDRSSPNLDELLHHQLNIRGFNSARLRRTRTVENMDPVVIFAEEPESEDFWQQSPASTHEAPVGGGKASETSEPRVGEKEEVKAEEEEEICSIPLSELTSSDGQTNVEKDAESSVRDPGVQHTVLLQNPSQALESLQDMQDLVTNPTAATNTSQGPSIESCDLPVDLCPRTTKTTTRSASQAKEDPPGCMEPELVFRTDRFGDADADKASADSDLASEDSKTESEKDWSSGGLNA